MPMLSTVGAWATALPFPLRASLSSGGSSKPSFSNDRAKGPIQADRWRAAMACA